jgi:hypothetical protein
MKVVINDCFGGFSISHAALMRLRTLGCPHALAEIAYGERFCRDQPPHIPEREEETRKNSAFSEKYELFDAEGHLLCGRKDGAATDEEYYCHGDEERDCPFLVRVVEQMGKKAGGSGGTKLKVVEIPDDIEWEISEYDGSETVEEKHRSWS